MSLKDSTISTNIPEIYSGGALQRDYIDPWSPNFYNEFVGLYWNNNFIEHSLKLRPSNTGEFIDFESFKTRASCHYLLDLLPDEGLEEIKESIEDAIEFYLTKPKNGFAQLSSPSFEIGLGEAYERPVFQIAED